MNGSEFNLPGVNLFNLYQYLVIFFVASLRISSFLISAPFFSLGGIPPSEKNGALIKNDEILKDATKKITKYWYKLNKFTPGRLNSDPFIINFFQI